VRPRDHIETAKLFSEVVWALVGLGIAAWTVSLAVLVWRDSDLLLLWTFLLTPAVVPVLVWCLWRTWWHRREAAL
jgi:hypothetical protein